MHIKVKYFILGFMTVIISLIFLTSYLVSYHLNSNLKYPKLYSVESNLASKGLSVVPIVFAINEKMALPLAVTIESIIEHASDDHLYNIYILYTDLSASRRDKLKRLEAKNIQINFIPVKHLLESLIFPINPSLSHITQETYYRFFIPFLLSYEKIIWLDSDLIIQHDIAQLYNVQLGNNLIAGVADILTDEEEKNRIDWGIKYQQHINAGVLLINNKLWQKENIHIKCLDEITSPQHEWSLMDQDIINFICQDRVLILSPKWNFLYAAFYWNKLKYLDRIKNINPSEFSIIHYNGYIKPWDYPNKKLAELWWKYAKKTPLYEEIVNKYVPKDRKN